ncbi:MAG: SRPBCC family protein [Verrucomicrobiota bacterium]
MPKFSVRKSIHIDAPVEKVHASVRDFKQWPAWSPWLIAEPDCPLTFADDGKSYSWDGRIIGSGGMEVVGEEAPGAIHYRLTFLKPWKSVSAVTFSFHESKGGTEVVWEMNSSLPFIMFWMKNMMTAFIGMDYERGLVMLKQQLEGGRVRSKLDFPGEQDYPGCHYVGIQSEGSTKDIGELMKRDLEKLDAWRQESDAKPAGGLISIYQKWDPVKQQCGYILALPLEAPLTAPPSGMVTGEIPACQSYVVRHAGPYPQLGNAWAAGMMHARSKIFRQSRSIKPFELYENSPETTPEDELVTLVHFPVKA